VNQLSSILKQKLNGATRVAVLGIGSKLRSDDAAGIVTAQKIEKLSSKKKLQSQLKVFIGETAPENLTGEIKRFQPSHLIIIDAADLGHNPGQVSTIDPQKIEGISFCTHRLPLKVLINYLRQSCNCEVMIIGIQPKDVSVCGPISKEVSEAVKELAVTIIDFFTKN
jgi:hydrogenase 3 maturation protease